MSAAASGDKMAFHEGGVRHSRRKGPVQVTSNSLVQYKTVLGTARQGDGVPGMRGWPDSASKADWFLTSEIRCLLLSNAVLSFHLPCSGLPPVPLVSGFAVLPTHLAPPVSSLLPAALATFRRRLLQLCTPMRSSAPVWGWAPKLPSQANS